MEAWGYAQECIIVASAAYAGRGRGARTERENSVLCRDPETPMSDNGPDLPSLECCVDSINAA